LDDDYDYDDNDANTTNLMCSINSQMNYRHRTSKTKQKRNNKLIIEIK
jgi:hypothetical protein